MIYWLTIQHNKVNAVRLVGIDPGRHGALAFFDTDAGTLAVAPIPIIGQQRSEKMKFFVDEGRLVELLRVHQPEVAYIEDVFSMPSDGHVGAFSFGENKGVLKGTLAGVGCERRYVAPARWKAELGCTANKAETKKIARLLLPKCAGILKSEGKCEAALIGLWGCLSLGLRVAAVHPAPCK